MPSCWKPVLSLHKGQKVTELETHLLSWSIIASVIPSSGFGGGNHRVPSSLTKKQQPAPSTQRRSSTSNCRQPEPLLWIPTVVSIKDRRVIGENTHSSSSICLSGQTHSLKGRQTLYHFSLQSCICLEFRRALNDALVTVHSLHSSSMFIWESINSGEKGLLISGFLFKFFYVFFRRDYSSYGACCQPSDLLF